MRGELLLSDQDAEVASGGKESDAWGKHRFQQSDVQRTRESWGAWGPGITPELQSSSHVLGWRSG